MIMTATAGYSLLWKDIISKNLVPFLKELSNQDLQFVHNWYRKIKGRAPVQEVYVPNMNIPVSVVNEGNVLVKSEEIEPRL